MRKARWQTVSDYISKEQVIDVLKETGIIQDNDLGHLVVDEINRIPTLDEKEMILKAFERVVERFRNEGEYARYSVNTEGIKSVPTYKAIEIVKEEC